MNTPITAAVLCLAALPALAQDAFTGSFALSGPVEARHTVTGGAFGLDPVGPGPQWMSPEAYADGVNNGVACDAVDFFEVDYYYGEVPGFIQHVLVSVERRGDRWVATDPAVFYDEVDATEMITATWETYDNAVAAVESVTCEGPDRVRISVTFKAVMDSIDGAAPLAIDGTAEASMRIYDMMDY
ncbi:MAG: hypothetical protein HLUCCA08_02725 [Rhodobacteraceae bacterium HLUCCA08]|nr:MAG: hypothetical protein HLUCCA08_02725 [Rhodobacteraceae bacterium HLUCCA08]